MKTSAHLNLLFATAAFAAASVSQASAQSATPISFKDPGGIMTADKNVSFVTIGKTKDGKSIIYNNLQGYVDYKGSANIIFNYYYNDETNRYSPQEGTVYCGVAATALTDGSRIKPTGEIFISPLFMNPVDKTYTTNIVPKFLPANKNAQAGEAFDDFSETVADLRTDPEM